jgi:DNA polymerase-1
MLDLPDLEKAAKDAGIFSLDTETTSLDILTARLVCITFAVKDRTWIVPFAGLPGAVPVLAAKDWLNEHLFNDPNLTALVHNAKFDIPIMTRHGFNIQCRVLDTMIAEYITNEYGAADPKLSKVEPILGLKPLVKKYFNIDRYDYDETLLFLDPKAFIQYARDDASDVWRLWHEIHLPAFQRDGSGVQRLFYDIEMPLVFVIMEMESAGLYVDIDKMGVLLKENATEIDTLSKKIWKIAGKNFNIASNDVLSDILFLELKVDPKDTPHVKKSTPGHPMYATGKKILKKLHSAHKIIPLIESYRKAAKLRTGFLYPLLGKAKLNDEHRVYPEFLQARTVIGRLASKNPNSQNMPKKGGVRDSICAPPGFKLVVGDLSQIEYRILAHQSKDPNLIKLYNETEDADIHQWVADTAKIERDPAKQIGFGILYGLSDNSLAESLKISLSEAKKLREKWIALCMNVPKYKEKVRNDVIRKRYVETIWGRRRRFAGIALDDFRHRQAFHFTISGSAADVIKIGMVKLHKKLKELRQSDPRYEKVRMLAQVHDELVLQAPEDMAAEVTQLLKDKMEDVGRGSIRVPIVADVNSGITWSEAKKKPEKKKE